MPVKRTPFYWAVLLVGTLAIVSAGLFLSAAYGKTEGAASAQQVRIAERSDTTPTVTRLKQPARSHLPETGRDSRCTFYSTLPVKRTPSFLREHSDDNGYYRGHAGTDAEPGNDLGKLWPRDGAALARMVGNVGQKYQHHIGGSYNPFRARCVHLRDSKLLAGVRTCRAVVCRAFLPDTHRVRIRSVRPLAPGLRILAQTPTEHSITAHPSAQRGQTVEPNPKEHSCL